MSAAENIEKLVKKFYIAKKTSVTTSAEMDKRVLDDALSVYEKSKINKSANSQPIVWRIIMKSKIRKFAAAAVIIIAVLIGINYFGGSIDGAGVAFGQMTEAMRKVPWMHATCRGHMRGIDFSSEEWIGFKGKIRANKRRDGKVAFWDIEEHRYYMYDPENRDITIDYVYDAYAHEGNLPFELSSPISFLESMDKSLKEQGAQITIKEVEYNGQIVQLQEICLSMEQNEESFTVKMNLYVQPETKLLLAANSIGTDSKGNIIGESETTYSYPETGPENIYDLGIPRDTKIISNLPKEDYQQIWDNYCQSRINATKEYVAVITHLNQSLACINQSLNGIITMIDVDFKSDQNHRLERHSVFNTGEQFDKFWPRYKEQLGDSFESLLAWTNAHYDNKGHLSIYLYDGKYNISTTRDSEGVWSKLRKSYSPDFESMPNIRLEDIAWPLIGKTGHIIEDDYAKENGLICIECLQQGSIHSEIVSLPGRFLYYLDVEKDYMCVRKVTEWRPDAEWQENKNWLEGVDPEKIRDGSIVVEDITEVTQAANGYWYPKIVEVSQTGVIKDYKDAPLKTRTIKRIYMQTHPEFPETIFDSETLPNNQ